MRKMFKNWPNLCIHPIYHRYCDCKYHIFSENTENNMKKI